MAFPTTPILDAFTRANSDPLDGSWQSVFTWYGGDELQLVSNHVETTAASGFYNASGWTGAQYGPGLELYIDVTVGPAVVGDYIEIPILLQDPSIDASPDGYTAFIVKDISGSIFLGIDRLDGGVHTILYSGAITFLDGDGFGYRKVGSTITVFRRTSGVWAALKTVIDTTYTGSFFPVLAMSDGASAPTNYMRVDNFGGGTITGFSTFTRAYPTAGWPGSLVLGPLRQDIGWEPNGFYGSFTWGERLETLILRSTKTDGGVARDVQCNTNQQGGWNGYVLRWMTLPLAAQTISGTFDLCAYVQAVWASPFAVPSSDSHVRFRVSLHVTNGQSADLRSALLTYTDSVDFPGPGSAHWQSLAAPQTLTTQICQEGDSILLEFGFQVVSSPTPTPTYPPPLPPGNYYTSIPHRFLGTTNSSNVALTDATPGGTSNAFAPWVEFSNALIELPPPDPNANDACVDATVISSLPYWSASIDTTGSAGTQREAWWTHTFAASGQFVVHTWGSNYATQLDAAKGASCAGLSFQIPNPPNTRLEVIGVTSQSNSHWVAVAGETWWFRIRNLGAAQSGARNCGGSLRLGVLMVEEPQEDDLVLPCGNLGVFREGQLVAVTPGFYSQFPTGVAIDYTQRPMSPIYGGTNTTWRLLIGLFGTDLIEIIDLPTLSISTSEIDFIDDPLRTNLSPGVPVHKHPGQLAVTSAGVLYIAWMGNGFRFIVGEGSSIPAQLDSPVSDSLYGSLRVIDATSGDSQPGNPFTATVSAWTSEVTNPWAIAVNDALSTVFYTSGTLYIPVGGQEVRRLSTGGVQMTTFATLPVRSNRLPGVKGLTPLPDGGLLVCNGDVVQRLSAGGGLVSTYTPSVPTKSQSLRDVKLTADGQFGWVVDLDTTTLFKFRLSTMAEVATYDTWMLPGTLTQMAIVQPVPPPPIPTVGTGCPNTLTVSPVDGVGCSSTLGSSAV